MASEFVEDPVLRQRYRFSRDGEVLRVEVWAEPGSSVPEHFHPLLEERWQVVEGEVTFRVAGHARRAGPGDRAPGAPGGQARATGSRLRPECGIPSRTPARSRPISAWRSSPR